MRHRSAAAKRRRSALYRRGPVRQPIPFGKYYLLERINVGGMAEVFKAKATGVEGFERMVAVKRILPSIAEDEEFITMFIDEAKIAVQLTHANIAQIFDLGRVDDSYFIALEYVHGKDMRAIFNRARARSEQLPIPMACYIIMKLCEGLDYAHNKRDAGGQFLNLVHRDVSPQNILVSYEGEVKIIDFGIAKAAGKAGRTQAGILKGKFGYMSPEQVQGLEIDRRSDVFGVGICLYELLTGERLFVAESDFATLEKVRNVDIMPPSTYNRRIPEELEQIVLKALARDRDQRHQTAMQLHDELQGFMYSSGNFFGRRDLSMYMHRAFAEELERESARDQEYAAMHVGGNEEVTGLTAFDEIDPVSTVSALQRATAAAAAARNDRGRRRRRTRRRRRPGPTPAHPAQAPAGAVPPRGAQVDAARVAVGDGADGRAEELAAAGRAWLSAVGAAARAAPAVDSAVAHARRRTRTSAGPRPSPRASRWTGTTRRCRPKSTIGPRIKLRRMRIRTRSRHRSAPADLGFVPAGAGRYGPERHAGLRLSRELGCAAGCAVAIRDARPERGLCRRGDSRGRVAGAQRCRNAGRCSRPCWRSWRSSALIVVALLVFRRRRSAPCT